MDGKLESHSKNHDESNVNRPMAEQAQAGRRLQSAARRDASVLRDDVAFA
jgi:hypothetical protein